MKKSILFIFGLVYPYSNGVGNCVMQRAQCLVNAGFDVSIITNQIKKTDLVFENYMDIKIYRIFHFKYKSFFLKPFFLLAACIDCLKLAKKIDSEIIYGSLLYYGFLSAICGKLFKKISITEAHGSDIDEVKGFFNLFITWVSLKFNDIVISTNNEFKEKILLRVPNKKIEVLPNFIDLKQILNNRKKINIFQDKFNLVTVGRLVSVNGIETKGISYIIKAMKKLNGCILHIFGDGHLLPEFKKYVIENNLQDKVVFYGQISHNELLDYLYSGDVLILASLTEGFNMTVLETVALGTAVITTPLGGQKDYIIDGENGLFIKIADVDSIVEQVEKLRDNRIFRDKIAKNMYQTYLNKFTPELWRKHFFNILDKYSYGSSNSNTK